ncbi:MAG: cupin domain-containing protein [Deltaproteobacteria bacterium]|nr:cupin domain-containing protein [Deltaproteobacteria bacterium]
MKRILLFLAALVLLSCAGKKPETTTKEELTFAFGNPLPSPPFTGEAWLNSLILTDTVFHFPATNHITFAPGAHSAWHRHGGMVVLVTGGVGLYQEEGKPAQILRKGDVLQIPAGVRHWHGATRDDWFSQMVIYDAAWRPENPVDEDNTLSDADYARVALEEYSHTPGFDGLMFAAPAEPVTLPTFNGPIHLGNTLEAPNVAGCPGIHNVVFEPGVYNAWHSHAGGQVLIVTDGIGYHQIEGRPVEILHPGDVALCPPGVRHWHGATPGSRFAHLAANANPDRPGVEWFDLLPAEEYNQLPKE